MGAGMGEYLKAAKAITIVAVLGLLPVTLAGCAQDGIEFQGKIFEAVGLAGNGDQRRDVRTEARAPLVLPPDTTKLPEPGSAPGPVVADQQWPKDRDAMKQADSEAMKRQQEKYCRDGNWRERAMDNSTEAGNGPLGPCTGNIFTWMGNSILGNSN